MKKMIIGIIIGVIISGTVGVLASTIISSTNVTYQNKTVNNALDELYNDVTTGKELVAAAITNKGISTTSSDSYETMATNINGIDTDHTEIIGKISNLESKHNSDVSTINGSINNINQDLLNRSKPDLLLNKKITGTEIIKLDSDMTNYARIYLVINFSDARGFDVKEFDMNLDTTIGYSRKFALQYDTGYYYNLELYGGHNIINITTFSTSTELTIRIYGYKK